MNNCVFKLSEFCLLFSATGSGQELGRTWDARSGLLTSTKKAQRDTAGWAHSARWWKNPPPMQETWVWSMAWEDPLEKGMATHSTIPAWRISWTEEPGRLQSMVWQRVGHDWATFTFTHLFLRCSLPLTRCTYSLTFTKGNSFIIICLATYVHAESLQSCLTLCDPMDCSPPGASIHGILRGKNTGVDCHPLLQGIFLTQGSNLSLLHWQVGSLVPLEKPN